MEKRLSLENEESSFMMLCYLLLFGVLFCLCAWIYYHGFYTGYYEAYSNCKDGSIDSEDNMRFKLRYQNQNKLPFVKP